MLRAQARANYFTYNSFSIVSAYLYTTLQQISLMKHRHMRNNRNDRVSIDADRSAEEKFEKYRIQAVKVRKGKAR